MLQMKVQIHNHLFRRHIYVFILCLAFSDVLRVPLFLKSEACFIKLLRLICINQCTIMYMYMKQAYHCHRHPRRVANSLWKTPPSRKGEIESHPLSSCNDYLVRLTTCELSSEYLEKPANCYWFGLMDLQLMKLFWICCLASVLKQTHCPLAFVCWTVWNAQACVVSDIAVINQQRNAHRTPTWKMKSVMMTNSNSKSKQMYGHAYR